MTTRPKRSAKPRQIEALIGDDRDLLKGLMKEALQEVLEEMDPGNWTVR